ncbi:helix-hairpin-helix domain-containing protein [Pseudomonas sp. LS1212]|uniref:ComEA family DNA-binding protein n=1 Tax=Pseudomonas sp. LS1212 TaxID=2972478 RepID=UPI00215CCFA0|nr:helix-hairpin-helix domain-containing protein [Pseudomonas sp. LS1212]UVJ42780.1 helix-hairpin-helix domain-containing protein [Pseudomonas sp. LS1212]
MNKTYLSSLLFALLANASLSVYAAPPSAAPVDKPVSAQTATTAKVNLNTADAQTLQQELSGIGRAKAEAIVAYREANGAFTSVDELLEVKGIGKALLDKNRDMVMIN